MMIVPSKLLVIGYQCKEQIRMDGFMSDQIKAYKAEIERLKKENFELRKRVVYLTDRPVPYITRNYISQLKNENEKLTMQLRVLKDASFKRASFSKDV
jgi:hypothetical protein